MPKKVPLDIEQYRKDASSECFICNIVGGGDKKSSHVIIFENDQFIAFLNNYPTQIGQTLVCPKTHLTKIEGLDPQHYKDLMSLCQKISQALKKTTNASRIYIASLGSNEVNAHIHIHILPVSDDLPYEMQQLSAFDHRDGIYVYTQKEKAKLANSISQNLKSTTA